jgi:AraC-like DNA-binding protein
VTLVEISGRSAAVAIALLLAALLARDGRRIPAARFGALFALGVAATLLAYAPPWAADRAPWLTPFRLLAFGNPAIFWVLAEALFDDNFALAWRHVSAWIALTTLGFTAVYAPVGQRPFLPMNSGSIICLAMAVIAAARGRSGDLIEARRRLRIVFVVSVAIYIAVVIITVTLLRGGLGHPLYGIVDAWGAGVFCFLFALVLLSLTPGAMFEPPAPPKPAGPAPLPPPDARESALLDALMREMEERCAYREEGLSIAILAQRLDVPEYRLRRLINQRLGRRNFSAFLNSYRVEEVMAWLADPAQAQTPITTLALDAGFSSIVSFNRAFKARTGVTPSAYRQTCQNQPVEFRT